MVGGCHVRGYRMGQTDRNDGDKPRETAATDTRIARDNDIDPSDGMEVDTRGCEKTMPVSKMNKEKHWQLTRE
jgi:hypothetical protein